ncbi:MAG TPA: cellulase family glycosylhydrolase, partial [Candidatus Caenarcaniphilales bacterium]
MRALLVGLVGVSLKLQLPLPAQAEVTKAQADGGFSVSGTKIYNPQGREFVIKGVNIHGPNAPWPDDLTQPVHLDNIANCWKFNLVRVNSRILPTGQGTVYTDNNDTDKLVNAFTKRGIVVMFDAHDRTGGYYEAADGSLQKLKSWYRELAQKHKDNPYVWFNVMNEPGVARKPDQILPDKKKWLTVHREVIQVIREQVGAKNIIVVDGAAWGQDAASWDAEPIPQQNSAILQYA